jgi:hypothetical protein
MSRRLELCVFYDHVRLLSQEFRFFRPHVVATQTPAFTARHIQTVPRPAMLPMDGIISRHIWGLAFL